MEALLSKIFPRKNCLEPDRHQISEKNIRMRANPGVSAHRFALNENYQRELIAKKEEEKRLALGGR